ncbi:universal stress protein [Actinocrinis puniceicyclus]|uniref:Universal stress protein n=1 Tax=Actinocrinis puniceicyclus TaxID=977794 RepID=A0A8J7WQX6_9ACTN|nr:universal stress protein [Actinocrinis puniceicyclus]MBS2963799.1 universal stress protein [Actinocrinis puniceicyclus]
MDNAAVARVFVGIDRRLPGLAALRFAVDQARRRDGALYAVRVARGISPGEVTLIDAAFADVFGGVPADLVVHRELLIGPVAETLVRRARDPRDLLVVGTDGSGRRHGLGVHSISRDCARKAQCPVLIVPGPQPSAEVRRRRWLPYHREPLSGLRLEVPAA